MDTSLEEDLIAYHLGELSPLRRAQLRRRLERDPELAAESEDIAATLRAFQCETPTAPADALDRSWQRVRPSLGVLEASPRSRFSIFWTTGLAFATALVVVAVFLTHRVTPAPGQPSTAVTRTAATAQNWSRNVLSEIHSRKPAHLLNDRPGPLTTAPVDAVAEDPALAAHLDTAERVLTEVSHTDGPLPDETRAQVHNLLLQNAVYHSSAEVRGDHATAAVIDDLGRVLITLDAEPQHNASSSDAFRLQMNIGGVLLDLRILHHNAVPKTVE